MRILIADDNRDVRRGVARILSSQSSWEICGEAQDGTEAIQKATEILPDLILLDISMPGLSGLEVAQVLREKVGNAKIVIMSQHDPAVLLPRAMQAGAHACIDKSRLTVDYQPNDPFPKRYRFRPGRIDLGQAERRERWGWEVHSGRAVRSLICAKLAQTHYTVRLILRGKFRVRQTASEEGHHVPEQLP